MINKIVTLENNEKFLIIKKATLENNDFLIGIKIENETYVNEFKIFTETKKSDEIYLEEINKPELIDLIINSYILNNI